MIKRGNEKNYTTESNSYVWSTDTELLILNTSQHELGIKQAGVKIKFCYWSGKANSGCVLLAPYPPQTQIFKVQKTPTVTGGRLFRLCYFWFESRSLVR